MKSLKYIIAGFCLAALPGMEAMAQEVVKVDSRGAHGQGDGYLHRGRLLRTGPQ